MGMFDYVSCEYPLPELPAWVEDQFQTKSFDRPSLDHYVITADGQLQQPDGGVPPFTGEVRFYCMHRDCHYSPGPFTGYWVEYVALFQKGLLLAVELVTKRECAEFPMIHELPDEKSCDRSKKS